MNNKDYIVSMHLCNFIRLHFQPNLFCCFSEKLGMDGSFKLDTNQAIPPTPAPRSVWTAAPSRRRARQAPSSSDESDADGEVSLPAASRRIPATPSMTAARSQRASKTAALSKMSAKPAGASSESELDGDSEVTSAEET
jgi:condensin complex subunit 3